MTTLLKRLQRHVPNIKRVRDAKNGFRIEVTDKDCMKYGQRAYQSCAIAIAAKRFQICNDAIITRSTAYLVRGATAYRFSISKRASKELREFDKNGTFTPGMYLVSPPTHKLGAAHGVQGSNKREKPRGDVRHISSGIRRIGP